MKARNKTLYSRSKAEDFILQNSCTARYFWSISIWALSTLVSKNQEAINSNGSILACHGYGSFWRLLFGTKFKGLKEEPED
jgi:hypothetical protein